VSADGATPAAAPRKRRRRGGRGRSRREGGENTAPVANGTESSNKHAEAPRERKPRRERVARSEVADPAHKSGGVEPTAVPHQKPGLFRRIAKFFNPR
jgi:hypothetical protein